MGMRLPTIRILPAQSAFRRIPFGDTSCGLTPSGRIILLGLAVTTINLVAIGFANLGHGAALIGETKQVSLQPQAVQGTDALRALYRRPATIPFPKDNPYTPEKAALGKKLYFDTRLSVSSAQSCGSCHSPSFGWGDGLAVGVGHGMHKLGRHSPTVVNAAWGGIFMWDGRLATLEEQALGPIQSDGEMNMPLDELMKRLESVPEYKPMFAKVFADEGMTPTDAGESGRDLRAYGRIRARSLRCLDRGRREGDFRRGQARFRRVQWQGECAACHEGWNFTNDGFQDIGLPSNDVGRGKFVPGVIKMEHAFKTPGLREIARRAPFMHDGSLATLEDVVEHYNSGGVERPSRADLMKPLGLSAQEKTDLVAFLKTLSSNLTPTAAPVLPR